MTSRRSRPPASDPPANVLRRHLSETSRRELAALRLEVDSRLSALEAALSRPGAHDSIEDLIIDLARVISAEAEAASVRARAEFELAQQERAAGVGAEVVRAL